ncbi:MAG: polyprenyl synthetase family protein [Enterococcus sp.]
MVTLNEFSETHLPHVEQEMLDFLKEVTNDEQLYQSMCYSIQAGGKRIRPLLLLASVASFQAPITSAVYQSAAALEMVHTYSLIHDDLPAMDNDDLRRGKPTNHKVYGEALAILAGDGLLTSAFELLSRTTLDASPKLLLIQQLATASGTQGMVAGQAADIEGEHHALTLEELAFVHARKTGKLIHFALVAGGVLAFQPEEVLQELGNLADHLGLAFQIRDDLLDILSTTEELGKSAGKDVLAEKNTYPSLLGIEGAKEALAQELHAADMCIQQLEESVVKFDGELLRRLVQKFDI